MKIKLTKSADLTASVESYVEKKLAPLAKFVKHFEKTGEAEVWIEIARTSKHHRKGEVFRAAVNLKLPKKMLRAETYEKDVRTAVDRARDMMRLEIEKYKTRFLAAKQRVLAKKR